MIRERGREEKREGGGQRLKSDGIKWSKEKNFVLGCQWNCPRKPS